MSIFASTTYAGQVQIRDGAGNLATPTVGPTIQLFINGVLNGATVTVTATGLVGVYDFSFVVPDSPGDTASITLNATLAGSGSLSATEVLGQIETGGEPTATFPGSVAKLGIYNDALRLVGAERLQSESEAREVRYKLDEIWNLGAAEHCLRLAKPAFARKVSRLSTAAQTSEHGIEYEHTLPTDYIAMYALFSDENLDERVNRFFQQSGKLLTEFPTVYLRYVADFSSSVSSWTPDFVRVVSAYIAQQLSARIKPEAYEVLTGNLEQAVEVSMGLSDLEEPSQRPQKSLTTLTQDWLPIYNDALQLLGLRRMTTISDERADRTELDAALDSQLVRSLLEEYAWNWSRITVKSEENTRLESDFGYDRVHEKPIDLIRIDGVFRDEYCRTPLKDYADEGRNLYCNDEVIYIKYVSDTYEGQPASWPVSFKRFVAAMMAQQAEPSIPEVRPDVRRMLPEKVDRRQQDATSNDFMQSPPQRINTGSWVRARRDGGTRNSRDYG